MKSNDSDDNDEKVEFDIFKKNYFQRFLERNLRKKAS